MLVAGLARVRVFFEALKSGDSSYPKQAKTQIVELVVEDGLLVEC